MSAAPVSFRIRSLRVQPYALPFRRPFRTARETLAARLGFALWVEDEEGRWGVGESAPLDGFGMESLAECRAVLEAWQAHLPGEHVNVPERWHAELPAALGVVAAPVGRPAALHGLECALLDLAAQAAALPLARWLHRDAAAEVPLNATVPAEEPAEAARQAADWARQGFATLKLKVGVGGLNADADRIAAVREAAGPRVKLRIDANGAWSETDALRALERLARYRMEYCEQPVAGANLDALARVSAASPVRVAADESAATESQALAVLDRRAAQVLVLKPMALGGLIPVLRIASRAFAQSIPVVVTTTLDGAYARTAALHVAAALAGLGGERMPLSACGLATGNLLQDDLTRDAPQPGGGILRLPSGPGLGLFTRSPPGLA